MKEPVTADGKTYTHWADGPTKAQEVADAINRLLHTIVIKCTKSEGVRDYYHVGVIGYGAEVGPVFGRPLSGRTLLLFNLHLTSRAHDIAVQFPSTEESLADPYSRLLFRMSSLLPEHMQRIAQAEGFRITAGARGFVFNADIVSVIRFLDIGTRPSNLR